MAVLTLLRQLTGGGATALQHADFDPSGLAITRWLAERCGTHPWRMGAEDYRAAFTGGPRDPTVQALLMPSTPWDLDLQAAMMTAGAWVYEEQVRESLLTEVRTLP